MNRFYKVTRTNPKTKAVRTNIYSSSDGTGPHIVDNMAVEEINEMAAHAFYREHNSYEIAKAA